MGVLGGGNTGFSAQTTGGCGRRKRQGSSCPLAAVAPAVGGKDRLQPRRGRRNQTKGSLETCLGEMIRIAAPVATTRAIAKGLARAVLATREVTTKEVTTR